MSADTTMQVWRTYEDKRVYQKIRFSSITKIFTNADIGEELYLTLDNPINRALFQMGTWLCEQRSAIVHHDPCRPVRYQQREWQQAHFLGKTLPCTFWGYGNTTAMALLLTTDEEATLSNLSVVRRSIGNAKRVGQRCVGQHEELRSEYQTTRENASDGRRGNAFIASKKRQSRVATEATFWRTSLLRTINIVMTLAMMSLTLGGPREHVGNGDCHGGNFLALVAMQAQFDHSNYMNSYVTWTSAILWL